MKKYFNTIIFALMTPFFGLFTSLVGQGKLPEHPWLSMLCATPFSLLFYVFSLSLNRRFAASNVTKFESVLSVIGCISTVPLLFSSLVNIVNIGILPSVSKFDPTRMLIAQHVELYTSLIVLAVTIFVWSKMRVPKGLAVVKDKKIFYEGESFFFTVFDSPDTMKPVSVAYTKNFDSLETCSFLLEFTPDISSIKDRVPSLGMDYATFITDARNYFIEKVKSVIESEDNADNVKSVFDLERKYFSNGIPFNVTKFSLTQSLTRNVS